VLRLSLVVLLGLAQAVGQNPATSISVDANANRHSINPNIYGVAYGDAHDIGTLNAPLNRWGGNSTSRYNWQIDAHSAASDWYFETYSDGSGTPGGSADAYVNTTRSSNASAEPMFTIPMIDYLANLGPGRTTLEGFSVKKYGAQTATDPYNSDAGNGVSSSTGKNITGNNPLDTGVANSTTIQQSWIQHFISAFGAATSPTGIKYYILDNEPSLWYSTHRDVHPALPTYQEMYNKIVAYATAIRNADPNAKIVGFEEWSWFAMYFSGLDQVNGHGSGSDYATHNNTYYYPWLLQQLYAYKQQTGISLLDVLTVHCYNAAPGDSDDSLSGQQTRNRETRILWDPSFQDPSWYGDIGINGRVLNWIPTMKAMVSQYYPGLELGCTEYNWGDEPNLNGATTQADVLGIYGREGFDLATRWTVAKNTNTNPTTYYPTYLASQIYRNYDGNLSTFGDTSVSATVTNPDNLSSFAAVRSSDGALTVMVINKQQGSTPVTVSLANFSTTGTAQAWQISSASQTSITRLADVTVASNAISTTVPSQSITLFVIPGGSISSAPPAPTGLAATVGSGTVTLTWNASGGATSYTVKRGTATGGPYTTLGTVTSPSPTSYSDSGLTNGKTYYYVVSATNNVGTSANSAELAATPIVPPTFTSSATTSPNPVTQGNSTTITFTVTDTANTLTNGTVQVLAVDPDGNTVASQNFTGQNFTASQAHTYTLGFTPSVAGTFVAKVGVFSATGQQWSWNASAASITVNSSLTFSSSATATPSTVVRGSSTTIAFSVTDTGTSSLSNGNVELQVFDTSSNAVVTQVWSAQNFTGGQNHTYSYTWNVPGSQATGQYTAMIGVFDSAWSTNYSWNSIAASITVTAVQSAPSAPTGLGATPGNAQVALSWTASSGATSYNVYRGTAAGAESGTAIATGITLTSYTDSSVANGTLYFYKVAAVNGGGTSPLSNEASATPEPPSALRFIPITPCRVVDTRYSNGAFGSPALAAGATRDFAIPSGGCGIPAGAAAYSLNVAVVPSGALGYLTLWPSGQIRPGVATLNSPDGRVKSVGAIIPAATSGAISVYATNSTDLILDINGYFVPATTTSSLAFYPLTPCRVVDTRAANGALGGPYLAAKTTRVFPVLNASACNVPSSARAYSLNLAVVPRASTLGYLTAWADGQSQPLVASLNDTTGTALSNAAIVPAGAGGQIDVYATNATDLVVDIDGYFAPPSTGGLSLYDVTPCRVLDTRQPPGNPPFSGMIHVNVEGSACGVSSSARAYVFNVTAVPPGKLGYVTLWPMGVAQPTAAELNDTDGTITGNMAIVSTNTGSISAYASNPTQLVLDIFGYFAP